MNIQSRLNKLEQKMQIKEISKDMLIKHGGLIVYSYKDDESEEEKCNEAINKRIRAIADDLKISFEDAKKLWKKKEIPGLLVGVKS